MRLYWTLLLLPLPLTPAVMLRSDKQCYVPSREASSTFPVIFGAEFFSLCPHRHKPALEDTYDCVADLGRRRDGSIFKPTPAAIEDGRQAVQATISEAGGAVSLALVGTLADSNIVDVLRQFAGSPPRSNSI